MNGLRFTGKYLACQGFHLLSTILQNSVAMPKDNFVEVIAIFLRQLPDAASGVLLVGRKGAIIAG